MTSYNSDKHTKFIEVPQDRVWKPIRSTWYALVWEDGYDSIADVQQQHDGSWLWISKNKTSGFCDTFMEATAAAGFPASENPFYYGHVVSLK